MTRLSNERGQALVLSALFLTVMLGMAAVAVDVGSWYHADRQAQAAADASALAAAQELPYDTVTAEGHAETYATKNGGGLKTVAFTGDTVEDTVSVEIEREAPGFFSQVLGVSAVTVNAKASARAAPLGKARWVAPIVVSEKHEKLVCGLPCFGPDPKNHTTLDYLQLKDVGTTDGSGSFGFINLNQSDTSGVGTSTLGDWIRRGFDGLLEGSSESPEIYLTNTGNPFSSTHVGASLQDRIGTELLFPIYRKITGTGSNAQYEIVGFVGFFLTGTDLQGNKEKLFGYFTQVIWDGVESESGTSTDYGVRVVSLVE